MKKPSIFNKAWSAILCCVLVAATALTLAACNSNEVPPTPIDEETPSVTATVSEAEPTSIDSNDQTNAPAPDDGGAASITELGEGKTTFDLLVTDAEGNKKQFSIHTDETTVGAALLAVDLIQGYEGQYGLYVKTVDGITADYDKDPTYWAFYINGEYATAGVDQTPIDEGAVYSFAVTK